MAKTVGEVVKERLIRGTIYDPKLDDHLSPEAAKIKDQTRPDELFHIPEDEEPSVLVSLSPHALNYLDLRIAVLIQRLHEANVHITLVLRDHQASAHPDRRVSFPEGKARLLDVLELLGVRAEELTVITWTDIASRLSLDPDLYAYLSSVDLPTLASDVEHLHADFRNVTETYSTLLDVFMASQHTYHPSRWLLGGPTRYAMHLLGANAYQNVLDEEPVSSIPLPRLPFLPSLPSLLPNPEGKEETILQDCKNLSHDELVMMHHGFFEILEEALGTQLPTRRGFTRTPQAFDRLELAAATAETLRESLQHLRREAARRIPEDTLHLAGTRLPESLNALGKPRRLKILRTLLDNPEGLEAKQLLAELRLPDSKMTTIRRDLDTLHDAGLVAIKGIKPKTYLAAAREFQFRLTPTE